MSEVIKLSFIPSDFDGNYKDPFNCAMARAIPRELGWVENEFSPTLVVKGEYYTGERYNIKKFQLNGVEYNKFGYEEFSITRGYVKSGLFQSALLELHPINKK